MNKIKEKKEIKEHPYFRIVHGIDKMALKKKVCCKKIKNLSKNAYVF